MPILVKLHVDPVHFGIVLVTNLTIAGVTPPVGQMMFISSQVMRVPMEDYTVEVLPFLGGDAGGAAAPHPVPADHALAAELRLRHGGGLTPAPLRSPRAGHPREAMRRSRASSAR